MELNTLILCGIVIFLVIVNIVERWQSHKRESDLQNRLMARSLDEYAVNNVKMNHKSEYIGEVSQPEEDDGETYLTVD